MFLVVSMFTLFKLLGDTVARFVSEILFLGYWAMILKGERRVRPQAELRRVDALRALVSPIYSQLNVLF